MQLFHLRVVASYATNHGMEHVSPIAKFRKDKDRMTLEAFGRLFSPPINKSTVMRWERDGVPLERVVVVEDITGISRSYLRPDVFGVSSAGDHSAEAAE